MKIAFAPICACNDNRRIWRHNTSISCSRDVTDQLWWRHNAKSEKIVLDNNGEMSARWYFLSDLCVHDIKLRVRNKIMHSSLCHSWGDSAMIASLVKKKLLFTVTHALFFISCINVEIVKNQHCSTFSIFQLMIPTATLQQYPNIYDLVTISSTYVINLHGQRLLSYHEN